MRGFTGDEIKDISVEINNNPLISFNKNIYKKLTDIKMPMELKLEIEYKDGRKEGFTAEVNNFYIEELEW